MKKALNILIALTTVILVSSCIPTGGGGTVMPSNPMPINLQIFTRYVDGLTEGVSGVKTVIIDGDSIDCKLSFYLDFINSQRYTVYLTINPRINKEKYQYLEDNTPNFYVNEGVISKVLFEGVLLNDTTNIEDAHWHNLYNTGFPVVGKGLSNTTLSYLNIDLDFDIENQTSTKNMDLYVPLRKMTDNGYQYYWFKFRVNNSNDANTNITLYNCAYKLGGITTGQLN